ncbi:MAG TPA: adenylate/guanylate cyclase domain-containing protein, partial [Actinomycetota bacterium]|nr:adenylate/guanylate cyclase domain-containing protein [Actinomycetota bacterium]
MSSSGPSGTVTCLFTDIEGSTKLLQELKALYPDVVALQEKILRDVFARHRGHVVDTAGDGFFVTFPTATDAVQSAVEAHQLLAKEHWPADCSVKVRIGIHSGEVFRKNEKYFGETVHEAARVMGAAHGGQTLISGAAKVLLGESLPDEVGLVDLGEHRLKDLRSPRRIFQVAHPSLQREFPKP